MRSYSLRKYQPEWNARDLLFQADILHLGVVLIVLVGGDGGAVIIALNVLIEEERCRRIDIEEERCRRNGRRERLIASSFPPKTRSDLPDVKKKINYQKRWSHQLLTQADTVHAITKI